jgi:hypothetical protein
MPNLRYVAKDGGFIEGVPASDYFESDVKRAKELVKSGLYKIAAATPAPKKPPKPKAAKKTKATAKAEQPAARDKELNDASSG